MDAWVKVSEEIGILGNYYVSAVTVFMFLAALWRNKE